MKAVVKDYLEENGISPITKEKKRLLSPEATASLKRELFRFMKFVTTLPTRQRDDLTISFYRNWFGYSDSSLYEYANLFESKTSVDPITETKLGGTNDELLDSIFAEDDEDN